MCQGSGLRIFHKRKPVTQSLCSHSCSVLSSLQFLSPRVPKGLLIVGFWSVGCFLFSTKDKNIGKVNFVLVQDHKYLLVIGSQKIGEETPGRWHKALFFFFFFSLTKTEISYFLCLNFLADFWTKATQINYLLSNIKDKSLNDIKTLYNSQQRIYFFFFFHF